MSRSHSATHGDAGPGAATSDGSWISKSPRVCGGNARIRDTRITVWGLVEARRLGATDALLLDQTEGLTAEDLALAWEYAAAHSDEINEALRANSEV
jgi:uncharacterized protein (DUF433 family)